MDLGTGPAGGLGRLPCRQSWAEMNSAAAQTLCSPCKRGQWCLGNWRANTSADREFSGASGYISRLQNPVWCADSLCFGI